MGSTNDLCYFQNSSEIHALSRLQPFGPAQGWCLLSTGVLSVQGGMACLSMAIRGPHWPVRLSLINNDGKTSQLFLHQHVIGHVIFPGGSKIVKRTLV
jgi:hypothetical protein